MDNAIVHGYGVVGKATAHAFGIKDYIDLKESTISIKDSARLRYHFICLPTPVKDHHYFIDDIKKLIYQLVDIGGGQKVFIIRSTMLPGTCRYLMDQCKTEAIVHVPEFLSETTWKKDAENPDLVVIGGDLDNYRKDVVGIFKVRYKGVDIIETDTATAELIKCTRNALYSTKVIFANEIYEYAQKTGANYGTIKDALYKSKYIGKNHLAVHYQRKDWDQPKRGLNGKCLPKDLDALAEGSRSELLILVRKLAEFYGGK